VTERQRMLAEVVGVSRHGVHRYLVGFDDSTRTRQAPGLPNHVAWSLGHCAQVMHRVAERLDGRPLPESDFIAGADRGNAIRFGTESVCFGSAPKDDPGAFPSLERCKAVFDGACERLAKAAEQASDEALDAPTEWVGASIPMRHLIVRVSQHNSMHAGQIIDLRRALGLKSIFS